MVLRHHKRDRDKPDKPPKTTTTKPPKPRHTTTTAPPATTTTVRPAPADSGLPVGPVRHAGFPGLDWSAITRYDDVIHAAADPVGWPIARVRGHIVIESQGNARAVQQNNSNGWSYGLLQIVPYGVGWAGWHELVEDIAGLPRNVEQVRVINALYDPAITLAVGVAILDSLYQQYGTLDKASSAFFTGGPNWGGADTVNGTTGRQYRDTLNALIAEQEAFGEATATTKPPLQWTADEVIRRIVGSVPYTADFGFGSLNPGNHFYAYGVGHGTTRDDAHTGIDIMIPCGTKVSTPLAGVVRCVGNSGSGDWGQGCGAFPDTITGGIGNVTVLTDAGLKLTFGHVRSALVSVGQRVEAWQPVAMSGGMLSCHLHLDVSINAPERVNRAIQRNGGDYFLLDPIPAIVAVLGGAPMPEPPKTYAARQPFVLSDQNPELRIVVTADELPVLQYANPAAAEVRAPLHKGDEFYAGTKVLGTYGTWWWLTSIGSRIPVMGTKEAPE